MAGSGLVQGRIVWATLPDQRGVNAKRRPTVLLMSEENVPPGEGLPAVVVSTTFPSPLPQDHVLLPYSNDRRRPALTRLTSKSAAVCSWVEEIPRDQIDANDVGGIVPPVLLAEILAKLMNETDPPPPS